VVFYSRRSVSADFMSDRRFVVGLRRSVVGVATAGLLAGVVVSPVPVSGGFSSAGPGALSAELPVLPHNEPPLPEGVVDPLRVADDSSLVKGPPKEWDRKVGPDVEDSAVVDVERVPPGQAKKQLASVPVAFSLSDGGDCPDFG
jgi:hypothetical protein